MSAKERTISLAPDGGGPITLWASPVPGELRTGIVVFPEFCPNPACDCRDARLRVLEVDDRFERVEPSGRVTYRIDPGSPAEPPPTGRLAARLDLDTGSAGQEEGAPPAWQAPSLLAQLREQLAAGPLLELLERRWRAGQAAERERWRTRDWSGREPGAMLSWVEVFPDDPQILFDADGATYWAEDLYCANPACDCRDVLLWLMRLEGAKAVPEGALHVDTRRMKPRAAEGQGELPERLRFLWDHLRECQPDLKQELRDRCKGVRAIAPEFARLASQADEQRAGARPPGGLPPAGAPVGRNDPCPCGSGKKYKKCCLGRLAG